MESKFVIHKNTCVGNVMKNLNEQRKNQQYCDLTLKSNDGETFMVHKIIICAASSFFEKQFNTNFPDKESDVIELSIIPSDVLKKLIEFMYGDEIVTEIEEIRSVLDGALFLGLYNLVESCTQALIKTINRTNKFDLLNYAETYINIHGEKLAKECLKFILSDHDFRAVIKSKDFLQLSFYTIKVLVSIERNDSIKEENLLLSLIEWISSDIGNREQYINPLINEIHFDQISNEFLSKIYKNYDNLRNNVNFVQKMLETNSFLNINFNKTESSLLQKDKTKQLNLSSINGDICAVLDNEMVMLCAYDINFYKFLATIDRVHFGYANFKNQGIFLCGGQFNVNSVNGGFSNTNSTTTNTCKYFSFHANQFHELLPMKHARYYHRSVTLNDQIYVCGGYNNANNYTNSIEIFDPNLIYWRNGCNMNKNYANFGLCSLNDSIYATKSNYLERFDPRESRWTTLSQNDSASDQVCAAAGYKNFIYKFDQFGCKKFDIRQNKWINDAIKNVGGKIQHACAVNNEIYAVDGDYNLFHLNCENDSIIKIFQPKGKRTPHALLFV